MSEIPPRLLRETLGGSLPSDPAGCLDADTLATWAEGTLRARDRTAAEAHAASCARCQALLAAMVKTAPEAPPARSWRGWTLALGLATPLAAAVALVIWIEMPQTPFGRPPMPARASAATAAKSDQATPPTVGAPLSTDRAAETKLADGSRSTTAPPVATAPPQATTPQQAAAPQQAKRADEEHAKAPLESKLRQAQAAEPKKEARDRSADALAPAPAPSARAEAAPPPAAAAADAATRATASNAAAAPPAPPTAQSAPPTALGFSRAEDQAASRVRAQSLAKAAVVVPDITSPDVNIRWRILTAGSVARSTDGGSTWQTQSTGVAGALTAGSAPSPTLCWLVGPRGAIVVSTDGRSWQRVQFPEAIDLTSIRASDRANATVTAADGRTFTTTDGGTTWRRP